LPEPARTSSGIRHILNHCGSSALRDGPAGLLCDEATVSSKPNALSVPRPILQGFEFRDVSFTYPGHTRLVLSDVSFHLRRGERLALVGENGQGKTTIVKLLTRLYDPTAGQILLDGVDLREYDLEDL